MDKKPRFFCENCNAEVKRDDRFCKKCGHFFASVKCPACGKIGNSDLFKKGCPVCGYAVNGAHSSTEDSFVAHFPEKTLSNKNKEKNDLFKKYKKNTAKEESLPLWIYVVTISFLIAVIFVILYNFI